MSPPKDVREFPYSNLKKSIKTLCLLSIIISSLFINIGYTTADSIPVYTVPGQCNHYVYEVEKYPWDVAKVMQIMDLESRCNPKAINWQDHHETCNGSFNVLQVACIHYKKGQDTSSTTLNIELAYNVYHNAGDSFKPWTTCKEVKGCS